MYCPVCKSEYRAGFTRCAPCNADLVEDLSRTPHESSAEAPRSSVVSAVAQSPVPLLPYCGFLGLDEARQAREQLRLEGIRSEIVISDAPGTEAGGPVEEEYWLRLAPHSFQVAARILGYDPAEDTEETAPGGEEDLACSACGGVVGADESFCPHCGEPFEDGR